MSNTVLLSALLCALCTNACAQLIRDFHFVNLALNWTEAQQNCRQNYIDLVTIKNATELNQLHRPADYTGDAWIGLYLSPLTYQNWISGFKFIEGMCIATDRNGKWFSISCNYRHYFLCYKDVVPKEYSIVILPYTWPQASAHCRQHYTDLALIESAAENTQVASIIKSDGGSTYHIGLQQGAWRWSDNSPSLFYNWRSGQPLDFKNQSCTVEDSQHYWKDVNCGLRLPFYCVREVEVKRSTVVQFNFSSDLDLTDPNNYIMISQQIEKQLNRSGLSGVNITWKTPQKQNKKALTLPCK